MTDGVLPLHEAIDALHAWARRPGPRRSAAVGRAIDRVVTANEAMGAYLTVDAPPLPPLELGTGTLPSPPDPGTTGLVEMEALADEGRVRLGRIAVDPGPGPNGERRGERAAHAIELCLDAAWSAAQATAARERMAALDEASRAIAGVLDLEGVLQLIADRVRDLASARYAALGIVDAEGQIDRFITSGLTAVERARIGDPPRGRGLLGLIIREGRSVLVPDIASDPRRSGFPPGHPPMRSFLGVPVVVHGTPVGNLYLTDRLDGRPFGTADLELVEAFARHAAIAVENARLHERLARLAVIEDRERIGRELHDGIIQSIYAVSLGLEDAAEDAATDPDATRASIDRAIDALNLTIRDLRNYIFGLRPDLLLQAGLVGGLAAMADEMHVNTLIDIEVDAQAVEDLELDLETTHELLSIVREALSNVARHAQASRSRVVASLVADEFVLVISDNGRGMPTQVAAGPDHQGIGNMRARAAHLGGTLRIDDGQPQGTRIILTVPLDRIASRPADLAAREAPAT